MKDLRKRKYTVSGDNRSNAAWSKGASPGWIGRIVTAVPSFKIISSVNPTGLTAAGISEPGMIFPFTLNINYQFEWILNRSQAGL